MYPHVKFGEDVLLARLESSTKADVEAALSSREASFDDFLRLLSPAASTMLDPLRERAAAVRKMYFGKTVRLFAPLYISNFCVNNCRYCGFRKDNKFERRRLSFEETLAEAEVIHSWGIDSLLLVTGEDPKAISVDFLADVVRALKPKFSYIGIEVYPMDETSYRKLREAGVHGLTIFQETYDKDLYSQLHPSGPKRDYLNRIDAMTRGAKAGFFNLGHGALFGLYDWRSEAISIASHALWLRRRFWRCRNQFSFPRITPAAGSFEVPRPLSEDDLEQLMLAFRIYFPQSDIFLSTRELPEFRMRAVQTCVSHISAGSRVIPGAYVEEAKRNLKAQVKALDESGLGQFTVVDDHSVENVCASLKRIGLEPVFKDWDCSIGSGSAGAA
jgi:2-iminoacetate synthase